MSGIVRKGQRSARVLLSSSSRRRREQLAQALNPVAGQITSGLGTLEVSSSGWRHSAAGLTLKLTYFLGSNLVAELVIGDPLLKLNKTLLLSKVDVDERWRGHGIGTQLMLHVLAEAASVKPPGWDRVIANCASTGSWHWLGLLDWDLGDSSAIASNVYAMRCNFSASTYLAATEVAAIPQFSAFLSSLQSATGSSGWEVDSSTGAISFKRTPVPELDDSVFFAMLTRISTQALRSMAWTAGPAAQRLVSFSGWRGVRWLQH